MHPSILGAGLLFAAALARAAPAGTPAAGPQSAPACPAAQAAVLERFVSADCTDCWAAAGAAPAVAPAARAAAAAWHFDWITPQGDEAPLAAAALSDAAERAQRAKAAPPAGGQTQRGRNRPTAALPGLRLAVVSGPAWQGYFGLQATVQRGPHQALPTGATAWLALVEQVPAGSEGSAVARELVRSVAGPLPLDSLRAGRRLSHLRALRWPEGAQPARLQARAWIEGNDGSILAVAADHCP